MFILFQIMCNQQFTDTFFYCWLPTSVNRGLLLYILIDLFSTLRPAMLPLCNRIKLSCDIIFLGLVDSSFFDYFFGDGNYGYTGKHGLSLEPQFEGFAPLAFIYQRQPYRETYQPTYKNYYQPQVSRNIKRRRPNPRPQRTRRIQVKATTRPRRLKPQRSSLRMFINLLHNMQQAFPLDWSTRQSTSSFAQQYCCSTVLVGVSQSMLNNKILNISMSL